MPKPLSADPSEIQIVTLFRSRAKIYCPGVSIVGIPNASKRGQWAINQAKREGMATGFPDVIVLWADRGFAAIEFKTSTGKLSIHQEEWLERLHRLGHHCFVARSAEDALNFLRLCGAPFLSAAA